MRILIVAGMVLFRLRFPRCQRATHLTSSAPATTCCYPATLWAALFSLSFSPHFQNWSPLAQCFFEHMLPPPAPPPKPRPADASKGVVLKLATTPARALLNKADEQSCAEPLPVPNEARQLPSAHISHLPADVRRMAGAGPYGPDLHVGKQRVRSGSGRAVLYCIKSGSGRYGRLGLGCAIHAIPNGLHFAAAATIYPRLGALTRGGREEACLFAGRCTHKTRTFQSQ